MVNADVVKRSARAPRTAPTSIRLHAEIKAALEQAAKDDDRSVSSMLERILRAWLKDRGYLEQPAGNVLHQDLTPREARTLGSSQGKTDRSKRPKR